MLTIFEDTAVDVKWLIDENCIFDKVEIYLDGKLAAVMKEHSKPGWSINAGPTDIN